MRKEILNKVHVSHLGIVKCKQRARDVVFWPGMGKEIEEMIYKCDTCQEYRVSNPKEPMANFQQGHGRWWLQICLCGMVVTI